MALSPVSEDRGKEEGAAGLGLLLQGWALESLGSGALARQGKTQCGRVMVAAEGNKRKGPVKEAERAWRKGVLRLQDTSA